jgi:hypothetical protein
MTEVEVEQKLDVVASLLLDGEDDVDVASKPTTAASSSPSMTSLDTSVGIGLFSWCVVAGFHGVVSIIFL